MKLSVLRRVGASPLRVAQRTIRSALALTLAALIAGQVAGDPYAPEPPYDPSSDWCLEGFLFSGDGAIHIPDGAVTQVEPYLFRVCQGGHSGTTPDRRVLRFFYNPARVEGISSVKVMNGVILNNLSTWKARRQRILEYNRLVGEKEIGSTRYSVYRYVQTDDGELGRPIYLYDPEEDAAADTLPPHSFRCTEAVEPPYLLGGRCWLSVGYDQIFVNDLFWSPLSQDPKIPVHRFPDFARDVKLMLDTANVTDNYPRELGALPFLE